MVAKEYTVEFEDGSTKTVDNCYFKDNGWISIVVPCDYDGRKNEMYPPRKIKNVILNVRHVDETYDSAEIASP